MNNILKTIRACIDYIFPSQPNSLFFNSHLSAQTAMYLDTLVAKEYGQIHYIYSYKDSFIKRGLWSLKFEKNKEAIKFFSNSLIAIFEDRYLNKRLNLNTRSIQITFIPGSKTRYKKYGFSQCEILCQAIVKQSKIIHVVPLRLFRWKKSIPYQHSIRSKEKRVMNIQKTLMVPRRLGDTKKKTLIIDDITTTGATLYEARRALAHAGFIDIDLWCIAH